MKKIFSGNVSRLAVLIAFFINGVMMATWVSRIPAVQARLSLSEGALGLILLGMSVGVLSALSLAGGLIARFGSHKVTLAGALSMCFILPLLVLAPHPVLLWIVLFLFGGAMSLMDVSMNEQAVLVERKAERPLMSSFHAAYSVGGLAGALIGAGMASIKGLPPVFHFLLISIVFGIVIGVTFPYLLPVKPEVQENKSVFRLPERALWVLGAIAFCSAIAEGAMADWSGVYLTRVLQTNAGFAALGFAAFSLTMTLGRMFGDALTKSWKPALIVRFGGGIAAAGLLAIILAKEPIISLMGFAAVGLGLSNIIPLAFSAAGNFPGITAGTGIAGVATIGYAGFLAGPPVIGLIAEKTSLRIALVLVTVLIGSLIFFGKAIGQPAKEQHADG